MPLQLVLNHRAVDSMAVEFIRWHGTESSDPAEAFECLELVKLFLTSQHAISGSSSATEIPGESVDPAVGSVIAALDPEQAEDALDDFYFALHSFAHFLKETGRWTGTEEAYEELHSVLGGGIGAATPSLPDILVPQLSDEEQDTAFTAMPLIQRASSLLEWLGTGKEVTATGALRLKDIEPAAAAVGVQARGKRGAQRIVSRDEPEAAGGQPDAPLEVNTMFDVPVLRDIWAALVGAGLISLSPTRAVPGPASTAWNSAKIEDRLDMRRTLSVVLLVRVLSESDDTWDREAVSETMRAILVYGTTDDPVPVAQLESLAALDPKGPFLDDTEHADPELADSRLEEIYASFTAMQARRRLSLLAELGLVEASTAYRVPPVAVQCVDLALGYLNPAHEPADGVETESNVLPLHAPSQTGDGLNHR
ncbi:hypothetical protein [Pseudarthrobacter sp. TAF60_1]|uniref:hypothetical protein n=1 Tax=Pseudarthrobacter sp. TAF60_1 TaxID=3233071 RepID=UPI003F943498